METFGYLGAAAIGILLGLLGGGGSILSVPVLAYFFGIPAEAAAYHSLLIVGVCAAVGAVPFARRRLVNLKAATVFAAPSLGGVLLARRVILPNLPEPRDLIIMLVFGAVMLAAAWPMLRQKKQVPDNERNRSRSFKTAISGLFVGILTGFVGAGGGFLIVPALVAALAFKMNAAIGTSLAIIAINSLCGFGAEWLPGTPVRWHMMIPFLAAALTGVAASSPLRGRISEPTLKRAFGWIVLATGVFTIFKQLVLP